MGVWLQLWLVAALPSAAAASVATGPDTVTVFEHVSVVPMDRERVLRDQTVVVHGDHIAALGPAAKVKVPVGATRVDGTGKFLLPGLADMHVHLPTTRSTSPSDSGNVLDTLGPWRTAQAERVLLTALAHGITTVRNMNGQPWHLALRARAARGKLLSPRIYTAGPIVYPTSVTVETAAQVVAAQQAAGYDFLKPYSGLWAPGVFDTLMAAATRSRFPVAGHAPTGDSTSLERALAVPYRSLEHLHGYLEYLLGDAKYDVIRRDSLWRPDEARLRRIVDATRRAGVWNDLTLAVNGISLVGGPRRIRALSWVVRTLRDAGTGLLLGTDSWYCGHESLEAGHDERDIGPWQFGFSLRHELETMVAVGLTPYEALGAGTRNVAAFLGTQDSAGTIAVGKRADLVLLDQDPLQTFAGLARPAGVMIGGRWLPRIELEAQLNRLGVTERGVGKCLDQ